MTSPTLPGINISILPNARTQFINQDGNPLVNGTVGFYIPGTLVPKDTWEDAFQVTSNINPVVLDDLGSAAIWGTGLYRQIVKDAQGNTIWDAVTSATGSGIGVSVQEFGAVGDGAHDDTVAFQDAINWSIANDRPVIVPEIPGMSSSYRLTSLTDAGGAELQGLGMPKITATLGSAPTLVINGPNSTYTNMHWTDTGTSTVFLIQINAAASGCRFENHEIHIGNSGISVFSDYNTFEDIWAFEMRGTLIHGFSTAQHNTVNNYGGRNLNSGIVLDAADNNVGAENGPGWWTVSNGHKWVDPAFMTAQQLASTGNPVTDPITGFVYTTYGGDIFAQTIEAHDCFAQNLITEQAADSSITINGNRTTVINFVAMNGVNAGLSVACNFGLFIGCRSYNMEDGIVCRSAFGGFPYGNYFFGCFSNYSRAKGILTGTENYREWVPLTSFPSPVSYTAVADNPSAPTIWRAYRTTGGSTENFGSIRMTGESFSTVYTDHSSGDTPPFGINTAGNPNAWHFISKSVSELPQQNVFVSCSIENTIGGSINDWNNGVGNAQNFRYSSPGWSDGLIVAGKASNLQAGTPVFAIAAPSTTTELTLDGATPVITNEYTVQPNESGTLVGSLIMRAVNSSATATYQIAISFDRSGAGGGSLLRGSSTITKLWDTGDSFWADISVTVTFDPSTNFTVKVNTVNASSTVSIWGKFTPLVTLAEGNPPT